MQRLKTLWLAGLVCLVIILGGAGFFVYRAVSKVDPALLITETMAKAQQSRSFRYQVQSDYSIGSEKRSWTQVEGEKADTSYHFKGTILGTPVEIYQIGSRSYTLDPVNKKWYVLDGADLTRQQIYYAEIDPLANFKFKVIQNPRLVGTEKVNNRNCWVVEFQPEVDSQYLEMWWQNYTYRLWVEKRGHTLAKGLVTAENKNSPGTWLTMTVTFQDFNRKIAINPPES
ncbi:MAG: hypothetical protein ABSA82_07810 [Thermacetogeniaceae bacterium]